MKLERFDAATDEAIARQVSAELQDLWQPQHVRRYTDIELLTALTSARPGTRYRVAVESELRRRETHRPMQLALTLSALAFVMAAAALILTLAGSDTLRFLLARLTGA